MISNDVSKLFLQNREVNTVKDWIPLKGDFKVVKGSDIVFAKLDQKPDIDDGECIRLECSQFTILSGTGNGKSGRSSLSRTCATASGDWIPNSNKVAKNSIPSGNPEAAARIANEIGRKVFHPKLIN